MAFSSNRNMARGVDVPDDFSLRMVLLMKIPPPSFCEKAWLLHLEVDDHSCIEPF